MVSMKRGQAAGLTVEQRLTELRVRRESVICAIEALEGWMRVSKLLGELATAGMITGCSAKTLERGLRMRGSRRPN